MEAMGMMRDLDQIRERDDAREGARTVAIALGGLAAACVLFAMGVMIGREGEAQRPARRDDPLARLDALAGQVASSAPPSVTYPGRLTENAPSAGAATELAGAANAANGVGATASAAPSAEGASGPIAAAAAPSQGTGLLPSRTAAVPASAFVANLGVLRESAPAPAALPVAGLNQARMAITPSGSPAAPAAAGTDGAITLQVSAFRALGTAQAFANRLRERGYRAFVASAPPQVGSGVVWHRVRIGPFTTLRDANQYRAQFESRERLPTYVVRRDAEDHSR